MTWRQPSGWHGTVEDHGWQQTGINESGQEIWQLVQTWRETRDDMGEAQGPPNHPSKGTDWQIKNAAQKS